MSHSFHSVYRIYIRIFYFPKVDVANFSLLTCRKTIRKLERISDVNDKTCICVPKACFPIFEKIFCRWDLKEGFTMDGIDVF